MTQQIQVKEQMIQVKNLKLQLLKTQEMMLLEEMEQVQVEQKPVEMKLLHIFQLQKNLLEIGQIMLKLPLLTFQK